MPNLEEITFTSKDIPENIEITPELLSEQASEILAKYFEFEGIKNYKILETNKTKKSFFGAIEIEGEKFFFKFASRDSIFKELQGYRLAGVFPHETVRGHHFAEQCAFYIQDYCEEVASGDLLMTNLNSVMSTGNQSEHEAALLRSGKMLQCVANIFSRTLSIEPRVEIGKNDAFFNDRLIPGGRIDKYYSSDKIIFKIGDRTISVKDVMNGRYYVNEVQMDNSIEGHLSAAKDNLSQKKPRLFILSQGDPTESNITADGNFFDFEVAGMNPLAQESAIFCAHSYLSGHYITPKYSESSNPQDRDYTDTFSKQIEVKYEIALDGNLKIDFRYPLPQLKKDLIGQYNNMIVKALEKQLTPEQQAHLVSEFKSAMLLRLIGVKNIFRLEEKDILLYLGLIAHFMQDRKFQSISEYIENKFVAI